MSLRDCDACGTSIEACNAGIRENGRECCQLCLTEDTHGLLSSTKLDRIERAHAEHTRLLAAMVVWRREVGLELGRIIRRIEPLEQLGSRLEGLEERVRAVMGRSDLKVLRDDIDDVDDCVESLEERVDVLERCLAEIEARLKIRRKAPGERVKPTEVLQTPLRPATPPPARTLGPAGPTDAA